jgi:hypothetical protein
LLFNLRQCGLQGFGFLGIDAFDGCVHDELLVGAASEAAGVN